MNAEVLIANDFVGLLNEEIMPKPFVFSCCDFKNFHLNCPNVIQVMFLSSNSYKSTTQKNKVILVCTMLSYIAKLYKTVPKLPSWFEGL